MDKRQLYEFDIRVPFIIRGPDVSRNVTRQEPIINIDIGPTIVDIATGGKSAALDDMDGISLVPLFNVRMIRDHYDVTMHRILYQLTQIFYQNVLSLYP